MSKIAEKLHDLLHDVVAKFEALGHPAAAELRALHTRMETDAPTLADDAKAAARKLEGAAEQAGEHLAAEAVHDATTATEPATAPTTPAVEPPAATTS
jgi:hypothetical protein